MVDGGRGIRWMIDCNGLDKLSGEIHHVSGTLSLLLLLPITLPSKVLRSLGGFRWVVLSRARVTSAQGVSRLGHLLVQLQL